MTPPDLSNFSITDPHFALADAGEVLWRNTSQELELAVKFTDTTFAGYDKSHREALDKSWGALAARAESSLPPGDKFKFYNSEILKWADFDPATNTVSVERGMFYKDITAVRSKQEVYDSIPAADRPRAFVLMNILITADNKIVLGRRPYFGDWPHDRFECPGSFLKEKHVVESSLAEVAKSRVYDDYKNHPPLQTTPLLICDLPRVMETFALYVTHTSIIADQLESDCYTDILTIENSPAGFEQLKSLPIDQFHPPSRTMLQAYFESEITLSEVRN